MIYSLEVFARFLYPYEIGIEQKDLALNSLILNDVQLALEKTWISFGLDRYTPTNGGRENIFSMY